MFLVMAGVFGGQIRPSVRHYLLFLTLVSVLSATGIVMYLLSEQTFAPYRLLESRNVFRQQKETFLLQRMKKAAEEKMEENNMPKPTAVNSSFLQKLMAQTESAAGPVSKEEDSIQIKENRNQDESHEKRLVLGSLPQVNYNVHIFYYPWYGNPETDGRYIHWNHKILPYWKKGEAHRWSTGIHVPPDDIGSNFYPALGPYSSADLKTVDTHMAQIRSTGTGVVAMSWYPPDEADENGVPFDKLVPLVLDAAHAHGLKVCLHIEPYKDRNAKTLNKHVKYIINSYGRHPGFYKTQMGDRSLPLFYLYDSYQIPSFVWAQALKPDSALSLRGTQYDAVFIGLYLSSEDIPHLVNAGFDGFYTYFAADGFTDGSKRTHWIRIAEVASQNNLLFIPSIGSGYVDTRIRPWNGINTRRRLQGAYFRESFKAALSAKVKYVSVTSFNEWHEGTQIEPAIPKQIEGYTYEDYKPAETDHYLKLLKSFVEAFSRQSHLLN